MTSGRSAVVRAGLALGIGLGALVDGIVLHQVLQLHNMMSARVSPDTLVGAKVNMVWDGLFNVFAWAMTLVGIVLLWRARRLAIEHLPDRLLAGAMLAGWGLFNLIEGVIDHHVLAIHHVVERLGPSSWDWVFLASGVALLATGTLMLRSDQRSG